MATQERFPTGDGALSEWDPVSNDWQNVDEDPHDSDTTFISTSAAGNDDLFTFTVFSIPEGDTIDSVQVAFTGRLAAGTSGLVRVSVRVGGTVYYAGAGDTLDSSYNLFTRNFFTNPATGLDWTVDDVNGVGSNPLEQFGVESESVTASTIRVTQVKCAVVHAGVEEPPVGSALGSMHPGGERGILASAARTGSVNSADQVNYNASGVAVTIDVTAITATPSVVFKIKYKDTLSGKYITLLESAAITAVGTTVLRVGPALVAAANLTARDVLPVVWRLEAEHADGDSITYSCSANYIFGGI